LAERICSLFVGPMSSFAAWLMGRLPEPLAAAGTSQFGFD